MKTRTLLLAFSIATAPLLFQAASPATVREELDAFYGEWSKARTDFDKEKLEALLAPQFFVQLGKTRMSRAEFIDQSSQRATGQRLARFDSRILTLNQDADEWIAVITEKLEYESTASDVKPPRTYALWVTKDRFRKEAGRWRAVSSEAVGWERWGDGNVPPSSAWGS